MPPHTAEEKGQRHWKKLRVRREAAVGRCDCRWGGAVWPTCFAISKGSVLAYSPLEEAVRFSELVVTVTPILAACSFFSFSRSASTACARTSQHGVQPRGGKKKERQTGTNTKGRHAQSQETSTSHTPCLPHQKISGEKLPPTTAMHTTERAAANAHPNENAARPKDHDVMERDLCLPVFWISVAVDNSQDGAACEERGADVRKDEGPADDGGLLRIDLDLVQVYDLQRCPASLSVPLLLGGGIAQAEGRMFVGFSRWRRTGRVRLMS